MRLPDDVAAVIRRIAQISEAPRLDGATFDAAVKVAARVAPSASRATIERYVSADAAATRVAPALVDAVISAESGFDPWATSRSGARGLMQLMPQTAAGLGVGDAYDPQQNVRGGTRYLRSLLDRFGDVQLAVAAYNAGPAAVARYGGIPPYAETRAYVREVLARYRALRARQASSIR